MTKTFKKGDRVRITNAADPKRWLGVTGTVISCDGEFADIRTGIDGPVTVMLYDWDTDDLELISPGDDKIEAALAQTKKELGLCGGFDQAVEKARNMTFVERLDHMAISINQGHVFNHFEKILNAPEPLEIPEIGRWIKATDAAGDTEVIEVTDNYNLSSGATEVNLRWPGTSWTARIGGGYDNGNIVKWEYTDKPASAWKVGDVVPAGTKLGRKWLGEGMLSVAGIPNSPYYGTDRTILWIEETN